MYNSAVEVGRFHSQQVALVGVARTEMRDRRNTNRKRLKDGLAANDDPKPIGCHSQGSYAMHTMVQDDDLDYDIDDGVYFKATDLVGAQGEEKSPLAVRQMICDALQDDRFKTPPEVRKNCVRVYYDAGYHVDVPAYRRIENDDPWSGVTYSYELASSTWRASDPRAVTSWFQTTNSTLSPDTGEGQFRRVIRLLKMFSKSRPSWKGKNLSGFALTALAEHTFVANDGRDDISLRRTMQAMAAHLEWTQQIGHPVVAENLSEDGGTAAIHFRDRLKENLTHLDAMDDPDCDHARAMQAWDKVFYTDWFSQQPPPSDEDDGTPKKAVQKAGGGRFAR